MINADSSNQISRRAFLNQTTNGVAATALVGPALLSSDAGAAEALKQTIGIQVGSISFIDEGTEQVLDILEERGAVNTIFLTTFTYGRGLGGRQIPGHPFPDHGKPESDAKTFHGGNYSTTHPQFYRNTVLKQTRAPDHGDVDIVAAVLPAIADDLREPISNVGLLASAYNLPTAILAPLFGPLSDRRGRRLVPNPASRRPSLDEPPHRSLNRRVDDS